MSHEEEMRDEHAGKLRLAKELNRILRCSGRSSDRDHGRGDTGSGKLVSFPARYVPGSPV
jgi:hypothetical protein